jgi:hypothetical protein
VPSDRRVDTEISRIGAGGCWCSIQTAFRNQQVVDSIPTADSNLPANVRAGLRAAGHRLVTAGSCPATARAPRGHGAHTGSTYLLPEAASRERRVLRYGERASPDCHDRVRSAARSPRSKGSVRSLQRDHAAELRIDQVTASSSVGVRPPRSRAASPPAPARTHRPSGHRSSGKRRRNGFTLLRVGSCRRGVVPDEPGQLDQQAAGAPPISSPIDEACRRKGT